jgi:hypothetical protein
VKTCKACTCRTTCGELCAEILLTMPTTCNAFSEKLCPTSELPHRTKLTLPEMERGGTPPSTWDRNRRMAWDHFVNRLTVAECARKYQTKLPTAKARLAKLCKEIISASAYGRES